MHEEELLNLRLSTKQGGQDTGYVSHCGLLVVGGASLSDHTVGIGLLCCV